MADRSAQHHGELYTGEWLPKPLFRAPDAEQQAITHSRLSIGLLYLLERLELSTFLGGRRAGKRLRDHSVFFGATSSDEAIFGGYAILKKFPAILGRQKAVIRPEPFGPVHL